MEEHTFTTECVWEGDSNGQGTFRTGSGLEGAYAVPAAFGGPPAPANPEELLLSALGACLSITIAYGCELKRLPLKRLTLHLKGVVSRDPQTRRLRFTRIEVQPVLHVATDATETQRQAIYRTAAEAKRYCLISNTLNPNVEIRITPRFG